MGREQAAIAIAIVSAKPAEHFRSTPGRVFPRHGGEGEGRRTQSRAHDLGLAGGDRPETDRAAGRAGGLPAAAERS